MSTSELDFAAVRLTEDPAEGPAGRSMAGLREEHGRLRSRIAAGRPEAVTRQHSLGKLTARERLDLLLDVGSFVEIDLYRRGTTGAHTDGVVAGSG
ncbi:carboxyl transferase domain-containing protein, partial [Saccharothrix sp. CB00851]|uniref:carboxyl transferase domain-containing protein n=1 Tax=Saccharothrix sp. CB00851 TaxID=1835005 RepID=UPI003FD2AC26